MFTFYSTIVVVILIISAVFCVMFMNEMVFYKKAGEDTFRFLGIELVTPTKGEDFLSYSVLFGVLGLVVAAFWPIAIPILIFYYKFKNIPPATSDK